MIKVNLLPGGRKQSRSRSGLSLRLPKIGGTGLPADRWALATFLAPALALATVGWMYVSTTSEQEELDVALEAAVQDSVRFSDIAEKTDVLRARSDSVIQRVSIIQEIDEGRYVWPHILDEVARSLPEYTWLTGVVQVSAGTVPRFRLEGQAGNNYALTVLMEQLEGSPFLRDVQLISSTQTVDGNTRQVVFDFMLDASFVQPSVDFLETVPLFGGIPALESMADASTSGPAGRGGR